MMIMSADCPVVMLIQTNYFFKNWSYKNTIFGISPIPSVNHKHENWKHKLHKTQTFNIYAHGIYSYVNVSGYFNIYNLPPLLPPRLSFPCVL